MGTAYDPILAARELVKEYTSGGVAVRALDGVSLDIAPGSFNAIMGPSGSGKSTLLHLLGGLDKPTSGEVILEGRALSALSDTELTMQRRRRIGFVFQFFNLVPVLNVAENVALGAVIDGISPARYASRLDAILHALGIADCREKLPTEVSGGQQQRAAIARALFPRPAVLLADEPTGNLDSKTGHDILTLLRNARRKLGQTIVMVSHDPYIAAYADNVILIRDGQIGGRLDLAGRPRAKRGSGGDARAKAVLDWLEELGA